jgi:hypothetical protein
MCLFYFLRPVRGQEQVRIQERFFVLLESVECFVGQRCRTIDLSGSMQRCWSYMCAVLFQVTFAELASSSIGGYSIICFRIPGGISMPLEWLSTLGGVGEVPPPPLSHISGMQREAHIYCKAACVNQDQHKEHYKSVRHHQRSQSCEDCLKVSMIYLGLYVTGQRRSQGTSTGT